MPRFGAVDVGTNTVLLAIAEARDGVLQPLLERAEITRLGRGVDRTRRLSGEARARTLVVLRQYRDAIDAAGVQMLDAVCTSATRDAVDGAEFLAAGAAELGHPLRLISGDEEAVLTFEGALSGLDCAGPVTVVDVGGGSTEIISGFAAEPRRITHAVSLDIGSVRLTERYVDSDPASDAALHAIAREVERALETMPLPAAGATLVAVAGTATTLAALDQRLQVFDAGRLHGATLRVARAIELSDRLGRCTLEERLRWPALEPGRADVIVAGAMIVCGIARWAGADRMRISDRGVRWGLLARLAAAPLS